MLFVRNVSAAGVQLSQAPFSQDSDVPRKKDASSGNLDVLGWDEEDEFHADEG